MSNDWKEYQIFVLEELGRLNNNIEKLETTINSISKDTAVLKVKAGMWGLIGGAIPVLIALGIYVLNNLIK
jgi:hypothetical protein